MLPKQTIRLEASFEGWMRRHAVPDPDKRQQLRAVLSGWMTEGRHGFFSSSPPEAALACVIVKYWYNPERPKIWMMVNSIDEARVRAFIVSPTHDDIKDLPPLNLARASLDDNFGHRYFDSGFHGRSSYLHEYYPAAIQQHVDFAAEAAVENLAQRIAEANGDGVYEDMEYDARIKYSKTFYDAALAFEKIKIRLVLDDFVGCLDQDALRVMQRDKNYSGYIYEWLAGKDAVEENSRRRAYKQSDGILLRVSPEARRNRQQSGMAFPCLLHRMEDNADLSAAIDAGQPLVAAIVSNLNEGRNTAPYVTTEMIKSLWGVRTGDVDPQFLKHNHINSFYPHFTSCLPGMSALPPEWRPIKPEQWQEFDMGLLQRAREWSALTGKNTKQTVSDFVQAAKNIPRKLVRLPKRGRRRMPNHLVMLGSSPALRIDGDIKDFFELVANQICWPYITERAAELGHIWDPTISDQQQFDPFSRTYRQLVPFLFQGISVEKILRGNAKWHANVGRMARRTQTVNEYRDWEALFDPLETPQGVSIRCLTSTEALQQEGSEEEQDHCVGGYAHRCLYNRGHILSLRAKNGSWRSTLEATMSKDGELISHQHRFKRNGRINEAARQAEKWLINGINDKTIGWRKAEIDAQEVIRDKERLENRYEEILVQIGFDPADAAARDGAYNTWHHMQRGLFPEPDRRTYLDRVLGPYVEEAVRNYEAARQHRETWDAQFG